MKPKLFVQVVTPQLRVTSSGFLQHTWNTIVLESVVYVARKGNVQYLNVDVTSAPPPSKLHSSLVPLHPGVCVSRDIASSSKPDHFDIKAKGVLFSLHDDEENAAGEWPCERPVKPQDDVKSPERNGQCIPVCLHCESWVSWCLDKKSHDMSESKLVSWLHLSYRPRLGVSHVIRPKLLLANSHKTLVNNIHFENYLTSLMFFFLICCHCSACTH